MRTTTSALRGKHTLAQLSEGDAEAGIRARLRAVVEAQPDAVAVVDGRQRLTFAELAARACATAEQIWGTDRVLGGTSTGTAVDGPSHEPVVMLCGHDVDAVTTMFGAVLSGRPLLVMDPMNPAARLRGFVERLGARVCLTDPEHLDLAREVVAVTGGRALLSPSLVAPTATSSSAAPDATGWATSPVWDRVPNPSSVAGLGFTSGSTGTPKVVALSHRQLLWDAWACSVANDVVRADDVMANTLPMAFAAGMNVTLTGPLLGATMALYDTRTSGIGGLAPWIRDAGVTMLHASPAIVRALAAVGPDPADLAALRSVVLAGEAAYGRDVDTARGLLPPTCTLFHRLGSTETGLITAFRLDPGTATPEGRLPVGLSIGGTRVDLDDDGRVVVTRSTLASGYWHDLARTEAAFTDNGDGTRSFRSNDLGRLDEQGRLHLLGRSDHSVKVRGYLVEPGEVDVALFALPDVAEAVTVGVPRPDGASNRLVAYVVSRAQRPSAAGVRAAVRAALPPHMVPEVVVFVDALPRTDRGKIDRSALPPPPPVAGGEPPRTEWESLVAQVWARALELDDVPRDADFFELGGDSLAAEALLSMMSTELRATPTGRSSSGLSSSLLVEAPTVAEFARRVRRRPPRARQTLTVLQAGGTRAPLFVVAGGGAIGVMFAPLARLLGEDQPSYALHAHALERRGLPDWSVRAAARRHVETIRSVRPHGPYVLAGHSFGGLIAFEMARQLSAHGEEVALLAVLDSFPPDPTLLPERPATSVARGVRDLAGLAVTGLVPTPGVGQYWRFHRQSDVLSRRYRPQPYAGRAVVLVADSPEREVRSRWGAYLTGPWRLREIAGDHHSMLREPNLASLARVLAQELDALARPR